MIAAAIVAILALVGLLVVGKRQGRDRVVDEILAAELRQIDRERQRGLDANIAARWVG